jgi:hypothetical protein
MEKKQLGIDLMDIQAEQMKNKESQEKQPTTSPKTWKRKFPEISAGGNGKSGSDHVGYSG